MKNSLLTATRQALAYADLFDFPLTQSELWPRLIGSPRTTKKSWQSQLKTWVDEKVIGKKEGYFFLPGREKLVERRKKEAAVYYQKLPLARRAARLLAAIPTVWLVGLSGNLASRRAKPSDDIDLVIITAPDRLWLTRAVVYLLLFVFGRLAGLKVRRPREKEVADKLCLNLFLDAGKLALEGKARNLFTAHEVVLMTPLVSKHDTGRRFLQANSWVAGFFPNQSFGKTSPLRAKSSRLMARLNQFCFEKQVGWMKGKPKVKKVTLTRAFFHPRDNTESVLARFARRCQKKSIPYISLDTLEAP